MNLKYDRIYWSSNGNYWGWLDRGELSLSTKSRLNLARENNRRLLNARD